jgi:hypothetical protein
MTTSNGESEQARGPLELSEILTIETDEGTMLSFEVVGVLEDPDAGESYAVLHHEAADDDNDDEFIVTDLQGNLIEDDELAQHILDDFLAFADEEDGEGGSPRNGEA